jgi:hypothetical protein
MADLGKLVKLPSGLQTLFVYCPGCKQLHTIPVKAVPSDHPQNAGRQSPKYWVMKGSISGNARSWG